MFGVKYFLLNLFDHFARKSGAEAHALPTPARLSCASNLREASGVRALQRRSQGPLPATIKGSSNATADPAFRSLFEVQGSKKFGVSHLVVNRPFCSAINVRD